MILIGPVPSAQNEHKVLVKALRNEVKDAAQKTKLSGKSNWRGWQKDKLAAADTDLDEEDAEGGRRKLLGIV